MHVHCTNGPSYLAQAGYCSSLYSLWLALEGVARETTLFHDSDIKEIHAVGRESHRHTL